MAIGVLATSALPTIGLSIVALAACSKEEVPVIVAAAPTASALLVEAADDEAPVASAEQKHGVAQKAGQRIDIPKGRFVAGTTPGDRGRDPVLEPALLEVELEAFSIDMLAYPNDPARPPLTGVSRAEAARRCEADGAHLCSELQWERACGGPAGQPYAGGLRFELSCSKAPETCASGFGVLAMGAAMREWTSSDVARVKRLQPRAAAVRGARADAADVDHRCAHRSAVAAESRADDLGFRCCHGDPSSKSIASPKWLATVRKADMPPGRLEKLFSSNPRLAELGKDIKYFRSENAVETILRRGRARAPDAEPPPSGSEMTTAPILWSPLPGEVILLVTGRSGDDSFIVAFHQLPGGRYRVGSAMTMKKELGPIVLSYNPLVRRKMQWSTCWECYGETGNITYRADNRVVITQK